MTTTPLRHATPLAAILALALSISGCKMGPDYKRPELVAPANYRDAAPPSSEEAATFGDLPWFKVFDDPALQTLLKEAIDKNLDLKIAIARVDEARAQAGIANSALYPGISANVGGGKNHGNIFVPPFGVTDNGGLNANLGLSWEIDVWGRLRRAEDAAVAGYVASQEDKEAVWVSLLAEVAAAFVQLRTFDEQLIVAKEAIKTREETLVLFRNRMKGGVGSDLDVASAESNLADVKAQIAQISLSIVLQENFLSILLGRPPGAIARTLERSALVLPPPTVPAGLPSKLLLRRPDVRAAENRMVAANARIGEAKGSMFPVISLSGFLGIISTDLANIGNSTSGTYGASASASFLAPILNGARLRANVDVADAQWKQASAFWEKAVLTSFREVSDALAQNTRLREIRSAREDQVASLSRAERVSQQRYSGGVSGYLEVLDSQEKLLAAQLTLAQIHGDQLTAVVTLYRALGGGWTPPEQAEAEAKAAKASGQAPATPPPAPVPAPAPGKTP